jgi:hypothetical protein
MLLSGGGVEVERLMLSLLTLKCKGDDINIGSTIRLNPDVLWTIHNATDDIRQRRTVFIAWPRWFEVWVWRLARGRDGRSS